jgi:hypothetical protein
MVRSHPLCPLSYGRAFHAQIERKSGRTLRPSRIESVKLDVSSEPVKDAHNVLGSAPPTSPIVTVGDFAANVKSFMASLPMTAAIPRNTAASTHPHSGEQSGDGH